MLERVVKKAVDEEWNFIVQRGGIGFSVLQAQYQNGGEDWVRAYVFAPDGSAESVRIANSLFNYIESGLEGKAHRHYVLVTPRYVKHKTYFEGAPTNDGGGVTEEEDLDGVYLPPER